MARRSAIPLRLTAGCCAKIACSGYAR